jgi:hypothetical protein
MVTRNNVVGQGNQRFGIRAKACEYGYGFLVQLVQF